MRRLHVRGHENVLKRLLIQVSAFNLGMLMRQSLGVGTPRGLQGRICALMRRCCMIQLRREWGRFSNFSFRTPQRRISAYPARPSG